MAATLYGFNLTGSGPLLTAMTPPNVSFLTKLDSGRFDLAPLGDTKIMLSDLPATLTPRRFNQSSATALGSLAVPRTIRQRHPRTSSLRSRPYTLEVSSKRHIRSIAYNGQTPGPLLRLAEGRPYVTEIRNLTGDPEIIHWHGLHLPSETDGAMEEGSPMIAPGAQTRYIITPGGRDFSLVPHPYVRREELDEGSI